jgi:hypothetical protein
MKHVRDVSRLQAISGRPMRFVVILALAFAGWSAGAARAQDETGAFQVQGWTGAAYLDARRRSLSHCAVSTSYGGVTLTFALAPDDQFRIEIGADDWHLRPGGDYVATLMIDHREPIQIIAAARAETRFVVEFGADDEIIKDLREGLFLRVLAEHIGISFSLSGSSQALLRLRSCVNEYRGR